MKVTIAELSTVVNPILRAIDEGRGLYIDDHSGELSSMRGFVVFKRHDKVHLCPVYGGSVCSLNPLYVDNDNLHLSTMSVGGLFSPGSLETMCKDDYRGIGEVVEGFIITTINSKTIAKRVF